MQIHWRKASDNYPFFGFFPNTWVQHNGHRKYSEYITRVSLNSKKSFIKICPVSNFSICSKAYCFLWQWQPEACSFRGRHWDYSSCMLFSLKASSPAITRSGWPKSHCFQWSEIWSLGMFYVNISLHIFFSFVRVIYSFTSPRKVSSQKIYIWCKLKRYCIGAETLYFYQVGIANCNNEINL